MPVFSKIVGTGSFLPPRRVTNQDLVAELKARDLSSSDEWIFTRSGISARHFASVESQTSDLALHASQSALAMAGLLANQIDLIICASSTPDHLGSFPSTACVLQRKLGITNRKPAFDVQAVCSGFIYALATADNFIRARAAKNILVVGAEIFSRLLDFNDRATCVLFGDGAGAVILSASEKPGMLATTLHADGQYADILCVNGYLSGGVLSQESYLYMDGKAVFKLAVSVLESVAQEVLGAVGMTAADLDWLVPHQANIRIMEHTAKKLQIIEDRLVVTVDQHGNTSAASIPLALDTAVRDGRIKSGDTVLMEGVGGGFTWGAALVRM